MMRPALPYADAGVRRRHQGFTLIEVLICVAIVGLAITAVMYSIGSTTIQNAHVVRRSYAVVLAANAHEYIASLPYWDPETTNTVYGPSAEETASGAYDNIIDFATEAAFNPPIDGSGAPINQPDVSSAAYTQFVSVSPVNPNAPATALSPPTASAGQFAVPAVRVTVRIVYRPTPSATPSELYRAHWIRCEE